MDLGLDRDWETPNLPKSVSSKAFVLGSNSIFSSHANNLASFIKVKYLGEPYLNTHSSSEILLLI